jgi:hypothetical protein
VAGDAHEGLNHAGHRPGQPEQRRDARDQGQHAEAFFELPDLPGADEGQLFAVHPAADGLDQLRHFDRLLRQQGFKTGGKPFARAVKLKRLGQDKRQRNHRTQ